MAQTEAEELDPFSLMEDTPNLPARVSNTVGHWRLGTSDPGQEEEATTKPQVEHLLQGPSATGATAQSCSSGELCNVCLLTLPPQLQPCCALYSHLTSQNGSKVSPKVARSPQHGSRDNPDQTHAGVITKHSRAGCSEAAGQGQHCRCSSLGRMFWASP